MKELVKTVWSLTQLVLTCALLATTAGAISGVCVVCFRYTYRLIVGG